MLVLVLVLDESWLLLLLVEIEFSYKIIAAVSISFTQGEHISTSFIFTTSMSFNMNIKFQDLGDPKEIIATTKTPYSLPWDTSSTTAQGSSFKLDFITSETMNRNS